MSIRLTTRVSAEQAEAIRQFAKDGGLSESEAIRQFIAEALESRGIDASNEIGRVGDGLLGSQYATWAAMQEGEAPPYKWWFDNVYAKRPKNANQDPAHPDNADMLDMLIRETSRPATTAYLTHDELYALVQEKLATHDIKILNRGDDFVIMTYKKIGRKDILYYDFGGKDPILSRAGNPVERPSEDWVMPSEFLVSWRLKDGEYAEWQPNGDS